MCKCIYELKFSDEDVYIHIYKSMHREGIRYFTFISSLQVYFSFALISKPRKTGKAQSLSLNSW